MVIRSQENSISAWAFLTGVIIAIIAGVFSTLIPVPSLSSYSPQIYAVLVLIGLFVGFMNPIGKDSQTFLLAGTVLVIVSKFGMESVIGSIIGVGVGNVVSSIFGALLALFVPATIIVALKTVFSISRI